MYRGYVTSILLIISIVLFLFGQLCTQEEGEIIIISERIGKEIEHGEIQAHQDTVYQEPGTAFYLELGGKYIGSVNVHFSV